MVQVHRCNPVAAPMHRGGLGLEDGAAGERQRGHYLGGISVGGRLLGGHLSDVAKADVGLCIWPRTDPRVVDLVAGRESQEVPDVNFAFSSGFGGCWWTDMILHGKKKPK